MLAAAHADRIKAYNPQFDPRGERERLMVQLNKTQIHRAERMAREMSSAR